MSTGTTFRKGRGRGPACRRIAAAVAIVCLVTAVSAAPALASWGIHKSIGEGGLETPIGVAVDEAGNGHVEAGSIYATSFFIDEADEFNATDALVSPPSPFGTGALSGVAVNPSNHDVDIVDAEEKTVGEFNPSDGAEEHSFSIAGTENLFDYFAAVQIAVDAHGNVYVPDAPGNKIEVFSETGGTPAGGVAAEIAGSGGEALKGPEGVAIDSSGNVWVADTGDGRIEEFKSNGTFVKEIPSAGVQAVAVDGAGDVFASIGGANPHVVEYGPSGAPVAGAEKIGEGLLHEAPYGEPNGVAFDRARELLYVADGGGNVIQRFTDWAVATDAPSNVGTGKATLNGAIEVEAGASITSSCKFEYGPTTAYGNTVPCEQAGPYTTNTPISAAVSGLAPGVDYHYRISVTNAGGFTQVGEDHEFGPPTIGAESAEAVVTTATPRAHVTLVEESAATCEVEYGPTASYGQTVPCIAPTGSKPGEYSVEADSIAGLQPNTIYHYRFLATNRAGTAQGPDETFATFGIAPGSFALSALNEIGKSFTQAGGHPYEWTDTFRLNTSTHTTANGVALPLAVDANPKDLVTELPPGLIGNPDATPKCEPYNVAHADCSGAAQVGTMEIYTSNPSATGQGHLSEQATEVPIYNLVPPKGLAAQFGARFNGFVTVHIDSRVRTGSDYGVTAEVIDSAASEGVVVAEVTLWGVPSAESHDDAECEVQGGYTVFCGRSCPKSGAANEEGPCHERGPLIPLLSNPTSCTGEREARMSVEPWQQDELDGHPVVVSAAAKMPPVTGCGKVQFKPSMVVQPTSKASASPTGLNVELTVPQNEDPNGLATADLKDAKVVLPAGVTVNPSSASGLAGCPLLTPKSNKAEEKEQEQKEEKGELSGIDLHSKYAANCPEASKVGNVRIKSPLLEEELEGGVYVAQQNANPFNSLLALYIAAEAPERGVVVKLAGHVELDPTTGQLTTTFDENPQLPFETLKLDFFGGERAPLATPRACGSYQPTALLEPWSHQGAEGEEGTPDAEPPIDPFQVASGPGGSACAGSGFSPAFEAGTVNNQAGAFSPFTMHLTRNDGEQRLSTVGLTLPQGISGVLAGIPLCGEAQAAAGDCPAASKIGHVIAQAGVGSEPITLPQPGQPEDPVYLTGPYEGAPFGLSVVVPAQAGPFDLGTVVVRAKVVVNPVTAQVSVQSDPMPTMLQGIPLDVRAIDVVVDRPGFMFNPTSCEPASVSGTIGSAEGASAGVSSRYQAAGCAALKFEPKFSVSTSGKTSKADGASLRVSLSYPAGGAFDRSSGIGQQANVHEVKVELPKALPSRLTTLQKACTAAQFEANPAGCPADSVVGHAKATTPILPVPLEGPAYFVSHGGEAFPNLTIVLQGYGVTVELVGDTFISKAGITSSTFKSVPDVPVSNFELTLPQGPYSALAANGDLCAASLAMPTTIDGQNGAAVNQSTKIAVEGCKPEIRVLSHKVSGDRATIRVSVPSAGTLTATGAGIARARKRAGKAKTVTLAVTLSRHDRGVLAKNPRQRVKVKVTLRFTPAHGTPLSAHLKVLMG